MLFAAYCLNLIILEHQNKYFGEKLFGGKKKGGGIISPACIFIISQ